MLRQQFNEPVKKEMSKKTVSGSVNKSVSKVNYRAAGPVVNRSIKVNNIIYLVNNVTTH